MSRTRRLVVLAVLALAISVVTASGGFTTMTADRGVAVSVVDEDRMLLGVEPRAPELANGRHSDVGLLTLTNQFPGNVLTTVRANVTNPDPRPPLVLPGSVRTPAALSVGESGAVTADVVCAGGSSGTERLVVTVTAAGHGVRFSATRTVTVECRGAPGRSSKTASDDAGSNATAGSGVSTDTGERRSQEQ